MKLTFQSHLSVSIRTVFNRLYDMLYCGVHFVFSFWLAWSCSFSFPCHFCDTLVVSSRLISLSFMSSSARLELQCLCCLFVSFCCLTVRYPWSSLWHFRLNNSYKSFISCTIYLFLSSVGNSFTNFTVSSTFPFTAISSSSAGCSAASAGCSAASVGCLLL